MDVALVAEAVLGGAFRQARAEAGVYTHGQADDAAGEGVVGLR
ncbi:MAG TPA: hypothetical protein VK726_04410 [Acetobacteraceae bacterium]|nr:hypothetical protein [Acetobacteraceae bacterium]